MILLGLGWAPAGADDEGIPAAPLVSSESVKTPGEVRADIERQWRDEGLSLVPYKSNYFFPYTYNTSPHSTSRNRAQEEEAKFQFSVKVLLLNEMFRQPLHLYFGYTQLALWQFYDRGRSAPFRDINYEPELLVSFDPQGHVHGFAIPQIDVGLVHQSNGVTDPDSRSWNRIYARMVLDRGKWSLSLRPWYRIPDSKRRDDNPDITTYMGYGEATLSYVRKNHVLSIMGRNNFRARRNKGALNVEYSFPLTRNLTGLLQYFTGYGESLIDYNRPNNRFSIGLALSSWR